MVKGTATLWENVINNRFAVSSYRSTSTVLAVPFSAANCTVRNVRFYVKHLRCYGNIDGKPNVKRILADLGFIAVGIIIVQGVPYTLFRRHY